GQLAHLTKSEATERAEKWLDRVGIAKNKNVRISKYSGGMRQRLGIAQALIHNPALIMLDEPVSSLDPIGRREVLTLLERLKEETTILFSTHILNDAEEISDGLLLMHEGQLVEQGQITDLREKYQTQKIERNFRTMDEKMIEQLKELPGIEDVTAEREGLICLVSDVEQARKTIFKKTLEMGWDLTNFSIARASLEDMFME